MTRGLTALVWLRRDLRLYDHAALNKAVQLASFIQPVFVFDRAILANFPHPGDRRISLIANALDAVHQQLCRNGSGLIVACGTPAQLIPRLAQAFKASHVVAAEDYEPEAIARDVAVTKALAKTASIIFVKDQLIMAPGEVLREADKPYKVFTPYARQWKANLSPHALTAYPVLETGRMIDGTTAERCCRQHRIEYLDMALGAQSITERLGYHYAQDRLWPVEEGPKRLKTFIKRKAGGYSHHRNILAEEGTSRLSPYLRFGLISVRECVNAAIKANADVWLSEFIWREFYATILYYYPESAHSDWNPKYRGRLRWNNDKTLFEAWQEGKTGYPIIDAAMRQLLVEGWMHNRARMIVASFLTKNLGIDWRWGDEHFAQYLMDYDMASNVGGWQWAASTGTDAQPYFRVFNPILQSKKFDPNGDYIRRYVPELAHLPTRALHTPWQYLDKIAYPAPIVDIAETRLKAVERFRNAKLGV